MKLRDKFWLWGQDAGSHHTPGNTFLLPGRSRMTPLEGAYYFGIPNMCRVVMVGKPELPFDQDAMVYDTMQNVAWSIIGDGSSGSVEYIDEVLKQARKYPNIMAGVLDDFLSEGRMKIFTPERVRGYRERLHNELDRKLELWTVVYSSELTEERRPYLAECDVLTLWPRFERDVLTLEEDFAKLYDLSDGKKKIMAGCYMWDYHDKNAVSVSLMEMKLEQYRKWLHEGYIEGIIFCSNCIADLGLAAVDFTREWIRQHGDEEIIEK